MTDSPSSHSAARGRALLHVAIIAVVALWLAVPGMDFRSIENHEHPRFARIAQNILWDGDWVLLSYAGEPYTNKPPLLVWLIAIFSYPFGHVNPWTARLPSVLASFVGALATYGIGRRLADRAVGLLAALLLLSSWKWTWYAHSITTDMLLSGCIALALYAIVRALEGGRTSGWWFAAGCASGLGALTKGPLGPGVPLLVGLVTWAAWGHTRPRVGLRPTWALLGCALVFLPWAVPLMLRIGWADTWAIVDRELIHRITSRTGQAESLWYYAEKLPADFLPWTLLWPALVVFLRPARIRPEWRRAAWLGLVWALLPIVVLSLSRGKASRFILCVYPGWALLTALVLQDVSARVGAFTRTERWLVYRPLLVTAMLCLGAPALLLLPGIRAPHLEVLRVAGGLGVLLALMGVYLMLANTGRTRFHVILGIVIAATIFAHALHLRLLGAQDLEESPYRLAARDVQALAGPRPVLTYQITNHQLLYYFHLAPADTEEALRRRLASGAPVAVLLPRSAWEDIRADVMPFVSETHDVSVLGRPTVLAVSRAEAGAAAILPLESTDAPLASPRAPERAPSPQ